MRFGRWVYGAMYRVGFTPWDGHRLPARLIELVEGKSALPKGRALDVGCGTGDTAIYLAKRGWEVTAIDFVASAIARARAKTEAAGVNVRYLRADATNLARYQVGAGFALAIDAGCMHGLSDAGRDAYVREMSAAVAEGGVLLLLGFPQGKRRGPRGFDLPEVERRFTPAWDLVATGVDSAVSNDPTAAIHFYELRRRAAPRRAVSA